MAGSYRIIAFGKRYGFSLNTEEAALLQRGAAFLIRWVLVLLVDEFLEDIDADLAGVLEEFFAVAVAEFAFGFRGLFV